MTTQSRQNALFFTEDWRRLYEALTNVDFRAADQDTMRQALLDYIRANYPEEFNDWVSSSEFVIKLDILLWLSQNIMFRMDLNSRENFIATAERRESLIRLAQNIAYSVDRVRCATGEVRIESVKTNEKIYDSDGEAITGKVYWNDQTDPLWQEKWTAVVNSALNGRTQFGRPLRRYTSGTKQLSSYRLNSLAPATGVYPFSASVSGASLEMELFNADLDPLSGVYSELCPNPANAMHLLYRTDGLGASSRGTGWFLPIKQGRINYQDELFAEAVPVRTVTVNVANINQTDVWVTEVDADGRVIKEWEQVDTAYGQGVAFNTGGSRDVFEVITQANDSVKIRFGDGKFGNIPVGRFRIWFRTSSPLAKTVRASDVRDRTVVIPYASSDGEIYNLTMTFSLSESMTNAVASESNADIRTRASKIIYSQDRMVNGEDYNSFFLKDSSILKVKTVNRTFAGHGLSAPLRDPSGTYNNVKLIADDGRIYQSSSKNQKIVTADADVLSPRTIVDTIISPMLRTRGKFNIYYDNYEEVRVEQRVVFTEDSVINGRSRGRLRYDDGLNLNTATVGSGLTDSNPMYYVGEEALLRFDSYDGQTSRVDYVVDDGSSENGVLLKNSVGNGRVLYSVFPAFRYDLRLQEKDSIIQKILLKKTFGLRWDQKSASWAIIEPEDLDSSGDFSLEYAGDKTSSSKDSSWMVRMAYQPESDGQDVWVIEDRELSVFFESDREIDFYYANTKPVFDTETGRLLRDTVSLLRDNETRDSPLRRGLSPSFGVDQNKGGVSYNATGTQKTFSLNAENVNSNHVFVTLDGSPVSRSEWSISRVPGLDVINFNTAPTGSLVIYYDTDSTYATIKRRTYIGDDAAKTFNLGQRGVNTDNAWLFVDGLHQIPFNEYNVVKYEDTSKIMTVDTPGDNVRVSAVSIGGLAPAFFTASAVMDGSNTTLHTYGPSSKMWVFLDGVLQTSGYTIDNSNKSDIRIVFSSAPDDGVIASARVCLYPEKLLTMEMTSVMELGQSELEFTGASQASPDEIMVWVNGVEGAFSFENGTIFLSIPAQEGDEIYAVWVKQVAGLTSGNVILREGSFRTSPTYLGSDTSWWVTDTLRHSDGYTNPNGIEVTNVDLDRNGEADNPFQFREFVVKDGVTDLVVWRLVENDGQDVWEPLSESTVPAGTVKGTAHDYSEGDSFDSGVVPSGSVHWDGEKWLLADGGTMEWVEAPDQSLYRKEIGRGNLRFSWAHYTSESERIDPSPTNVHDTFVLTSGYDYAVRSWVKRGVTAGEPEAETPEQLKLQYGAFEKYKTMSDAIVWRPARYKFLFGQQAVPELRAKFVIVKVPGSSVPDNDLKLRVLAAVDSYFDVDNWDFGDSFYYSELATYIHLSLSSVLQSVVVVPTGPNQKFGRLFQVRAEPDELFISTASADDVEIAKSLTDTRLRIN